MKLLRLLIFLIPIWSLPAVAQVKITATGIYGGGEYQLATDIVLDEGDGLVFTEPAFLDMDGHKITTKQSGNAVDFGVRFHGPLSSIQNGSIEGFWAGLRFDSGHSSSVNVNISSRYIGVQVEGNNATISGGEIANISGVTNEKYAIGVQVNGDNCKILNVRFKNIYAQSRYRGDKVGEGVAVNFSSQSKDGTLLGGIYKNDRYEGATIGVFAYGHGGHVIDGFKMVNIFEPLQIGRTNPPTSVTNTVVRYSINPRQ